MQTGGSSNTRLVRRYSFDSDKKIVRTHDVEEEEPGGKAARGSSRRSGKGLGYLPELSKLDELSIKARALQRLLPRSQMEPPQQDQMHHETEFSSIPPAAKAVRDAARRWQEERGNGERNKVNSYFRRFAGTLESHEKLMKMLPRGDKWVSIFARSIVTILHDSDNHQEIAGDIARALYNISDHITSCQTNLTFVDNAEMRSDTADLYAHIFQFLYDALNWLRRRHQPLPYYLNKTLFDLFQYQIDSICYISRILERKAMELSATELRNMRLQFEQISRDKRNALLIHQSQYDYFQQLAIKRARLETLAGNSSSKKPYEGIVTRLRRVATNAPARDSPARLYNDISSEIHNHAPIDHPDRTYSDLSYATHNLSDAFLEDIYMWKLYTEAVSHSDHDTFSRNHNALLKKYFGELRPLAKTRDEIWAVRHLRKRDKRHDVTRIVYETVCDIGSVEVAEEEGVQQVLSDHPSEPAVEDDMRDFSSSEDDIDGENEDRHNTASIHRFLTNGSPFQHFKNGFYCFVHPSTTIRQALEYRMHGALEKLLQNDFERATSEEYLWLRELDDVGYSRSEIANLLLEEAHDVPWIYNTLAEGLLPSNSLADGPASVASLNTHRTYTRQEVEMMIHHLCGLAGVSPVSRSPEDWNGEVIFEHDYSVSYISYAENSKHNESSATLTRLKRVLKSLRLAAEVLQKAGLCQDYFTIVRKESASEIELDWISIAHTISFCEVIDQSPTVDEIHSKYPTQINPIMFRILESMRCWRLLRAISCPSIEGIIHMCCITAQFLCLGLVSFCQDHVGPLELPFINRPQTSMTLLGSYSKDWIDFPIIKVDLSQLTCFGELTGGPLLTFGSFEGRPEMLTGRHEDALVRIEEKENEKREVVEDDPVQPLSEDNKKAAADTKYHLAGAVKDIISTWGPGHFISPDPSAPDMRAIAIGGGVLYPRPGRDSDFHWEDGPGPKPLPTTSVDMRTRITIGTPITKNPTPCAFPWQDWRSRCRLQYLGVEPQRWEPNQRQLGFQAGSENVLFQGNQTWTKIPARLLKQYQLEQRGVDIVNFLGCYMGVQVSCCTGVARRVSLQKLLADLVPIYCRTNLGSACWEEWNRIYKIVDAMNGDNFTGWLTDLNHESPDAGKSFMDAVCGILEIIRPTGLSRDQKFLLVAWPQERDFLRGLRIPCTDERLWTKILVDSVESVTFAYMTHECLVLPNTLCQQQAKAWRPTTKCLGTAVTRYREETDLEPDPGTWRLKEGSTYHVWNAKGAIKLVAEGTAGGEARLVASKSKIPAAEMKRLFYGRYWRTEFLIREHHRPEDSADQVVILDKV
ncbi:unnamed protein product [Periconia digitata]|uniref:DUF7708 domain-containing protein n=1 Tax=Periconia digitata TaxID=1303443 RepID=A0A9W4XW50_9PLEO|nr:unnamed protein product [Periconia digitata]